MVKIERPKSLNELAVDQLRQAIISGDYGLGEPLSEARIAADLGTSKGPVRRAIVQLQIEGLVRVVPQSGTFVFSLGSDEIWKLNECRLILEEAALRLAVSHNQKSLASKLTDAYSGMVLARKKADVRSYLAFDTAFHAAIFEQCNNGYLADAYRLVSGKSAALRTHLSAKPRQTDLSFQEHQIISQAVMDGDLKLALKTLRTHIGRAPKTYEMSVDDIAAFDRVTESQK